MPPKKPKMSDDPLKEDWSLLKRDDAVKFLRSRGLQVDMPETDLDWITIWALIGWELHHGPRTGRPPRWNTDAVARLIVRIVNHDLNWTKTQSAHRFAVYLHKKFPTEYPEDPKTLARKLGPMFKAAMREFKKTT